MDIHVNNLDLGYDECARLNSLSKTKGAELLNNLSVNIAGLKEHWHGDDATLHINNLVNVYTTLGQLLTDAMLVTSTAGDRIIAIQRVRSANGSGGMVGAELSKAAPTVENIAKIDTTAEYYCDPAAKQDEELLTQICSEYEKFVSDFIDLKNELMINWTEGANRADANAKFQRFEENTDIYKGYLRDAQANLTTAVSNLAQL